MWELLPFGIVALLLEWCVRGIRLVRGRRERIPASAPAATGKSDARSSWRQSRWMGAFWLALGLMGLILVRPAIGWRSDGSVFWTDRGVRALDGRLRDEITDWARGRRPVGLAVGVIADGGSGRATLGHSRLPPGGPPLREALFEIGSITKTFTGVLLARLAGDGLVGLDSRVSDFLPTGVEPTPEQAAITLRHLATHTAGLPRLPPRFLLSPSRLLRNHVLGMDPYRGYRTDDLLRAFSAVRLTSDPGVRSAYSNFGFGLLGWILGRATGEGYARAIRDLVVRPLGLEGIATEPGGGDRLRATGYRARLAAGPVWLGMEAQPWELPEAMAGAGALRSTLDGMIGYLAANMEERETSLRDAVRLAQREHFRGPERGVGLAWIRERRENIGQTVIWHNGGTGGFRSFLGFTDDRRFGVVVLSNSSVSVDPLGWRLLEAMARS